MAYSAIRIETRRVWRQKPTMVTTLGHIALFVPDLRGAEMFYQLLFDMDLIGRETIYFDGLWYALRPDKGWDDAEARGIELGMVALRRGEFVLALIRGSAQPGQVFAIGLSMSANEIAEIRSRLPKSVEVETDEPDALVFRDPYQITWQIYASGDEFRNSGEIFGRWLEI